MTHRTRYFLVGSGFIVVVGLCTGLVAYYNGNLPGRQALGQAELGYMSPDVTTIAYADVRHIMDSEFRQRLHAVMPTGTEKDRFLAETGIDVERDIDTVMAGITSADAAMGGPVVLVRGRFNDSQIEAIALQHGATTEAYRGKRLVVSPAGWRGAGSGSGQDGQVGGIAFLEPGLLALGQIDAIRRAIDASENPDIRSKNADLMKFANDVMAGDDDAWVVGRTDAVAGNPSLPEQVREQLGAVRWFALTAGIDRALTCKLRAETKDPESGEQMRAVVNGALAMAKIMAGKDQRLSGVLDSIQATGSGPQMEVTFTVPPEMLDVLTSGGRPEFPPSAIAQ